VLQLLAVHSIVAINVLANTDQAAFTKQETRRFAGWETARRSV